MNAHRPCRPTLNVIDRDAYGWWSSPLELAADRDEVARHFRRCTLLACVRSAQDLHGERVITAAVRCSWTPKCCCSGRRRDAVGSPPEW
jgi:hypothetical protein